MLNTFTPNYTIIGITSASFYTKKLQQVASNT